MPAVRHAVLDRPLPQGMQEMRLGWPRTVCSPHRHGGRRFAAVPVAAERRDRGVIHRHLRRRRDRGGGRMTAHACEIMAAGPSATKDVAPPSQFADAGINRYFTRSYATRPAPGTGFATRSVFTASCGSRPAGSDLRSFLYAMRDSTAALRACERPGRESGTQVAHESGRPGPAIHNRAKRTTV